MPDTRRKTLSGQAPRGLSTTSAFAPAVVMAFSLPFIGVGILTAFLSSGASVPLVPRGLVAFFDLIPVILLWGLVTALWRANKYGRARLVFGSFPFYLGGSLSARLRTRRPIGEFKKMSLTLRCIEERTRLYRTRRTGRAAETTCDQIWADAVVIEQPGALYDGELPVSCKLPDGDYGSRFVDAPGRYWELEIAADTVGMDFKALFLLPVYARPEALAATPSP